LRRNEDLLCEALAVPWIISCREDRSTIRLKKLIDIRELLKTMDASPAVRDGVDEILGKDILTLASIHGRARREERFMVWLWPLSAPSPLRLQP
jgi:hypothetical protein